MTIIRPAVTDAGSPRRLGVVHQEQVRLETGYISAHSSDLPYVIR